jgi:hypothetical protein
MSYSEELSGIGEHSLEHRVKTADAFAAAHATDREFHLRGGEATVHD